MLSRLDEDYRSDVKTFLCWFAYSTRPMTLEEVAEAVGVDIEAEDRPTYDPARRYQDPRDVLEKCSGLIVEANRMACCF